MLRMSDCSWCRTMVIAKLVFEACLLEPCLYELPIRHVSLCSEKHVFACVNFSWWSSCGREEDVSSNGSFHSPYGKALYQNKSVGAHTCERCGCLDVYLGSPEMIIR